MRNVVSSVSANRGIASSAFAHLYCHIRRSIGLAIIGAFLLAGVSQVIAAELLVPPPPPDVPPLISETYSNDADGNRIDDELELEAHGMRTFSPLAVDPFAQRQSQEVLQQMVDVELIFNAPITQSQIDEFLQLGGEITYIYKAVSYGWNSRIPLDQIRILPSVLGSSLVLVVQPKVTVPHVDVATQTGRVRPIWRPGFAGSLYGFDGDEDMTIGIIDSGIDANHPDFTARYVVDLSDISPYSPPQSGLEGRCLYWKDFSSDRSASPVDVGHHGSYVAGAAWGTGLSQEMDAKFNDGLYWTDFGEPDAWWCGMHPVSLPGWDVEMRSKVYFTDTQWRLAFASHYHVPDGSLFSWWSYDFSSGATFAPFPISGQGACSVSVSGAKNPVITSELSPYPPSNDGFYRLSGVAPQCRLAFAKDKVNTQRTGSSSWTSTALDELVNKRRALNLRVVNISSGARGDPGIYGWLRQRVNSAVNSGVVVVVSAGNDGELPETGEPDPGKTEIDDPGRAAMALTIGASNDENQLTEYSSWGFSDPSSSYAPRQEDYKPDLIAPGGSDYCSYIMSVDSGSSDGLVWDDLQPYDYGNQKGTSLSAPFVAGCAALVIEAMEQADPALVWDFSSGGHARFVKMVLCATATETNSNREKPQTHAHPTLERNSPGPLGFPVGKDPYEGYGMINPDAAVEAVCLTYDWGSEDRNSLGPGPTDRRAWARRVSLSPGRTYSPRLVNPIGGDFDLYLYSGEPSPTGAPQILASSAKPGLGADEYVSYTCTAREDKAILVVKKIAGEGQFRVTSFP